MAQVASGMGAGPGRDGQAPIVIKPRKALRGHFGKVYAMHWSGDAERVVSASQDGKLIIWNAMTGNKMQAIPLRSSWVMTCAFEKSKGAMVACGGLDNLCSIYNLESNAMMRATRELSAHDGYLSCCRFITEGSIVTSSGDSTCILWDVDKGDCISHFADHTGDTMSLSLNTTDPNMFVSGSCDTTAKVWDIRTEKCTHTLKTHESDINSIQMFPSGNAFGTGSDDSSCRIFDIRAYGQVQCFRSESILCGITSVDFSKSGRLFFAGYDNYSCYVWDVLENSGQQRPLKLDGHENRVSCLGINSSQGQPATTPGTALCTGSWDTTLKIWA